MGTNYLSQKSSTEVPSSLWLLLLLRGSTNDNSLFLQCCNTCHATGLFRSDDRKLNALSLTATNAITRREAKLKACEPDKSHTVKTMIIIVNKKKRNVIGNKEFKIACNDQILPHSSFAKFTFEWNTDFASLLRKIALIFIFRLKGESTLNWKKRVSRFMGGIFNCAFTSFTPRLAIARRQPLSQGSFLLENEVHRLSRRRWRFCSGAHAIKLSERPQKWWSHEKIVPVTHFLPL